MGMLAATSGPTVSNAIADVSTLISSGMDMVKDQPIILAMFGLALMIPVLRVIKRLFKTAR